MKHSFPYVLALLFSAISLATTPEDSITLPGTKHGLSAATTISSFLKAMPNPREVQIEELTSGQAFAAVNIGYRLEVEFYKDLLILIKVSNEKSNSKFARWFDKQVAELSWVPNTARTRYHTADYRSPQRKIWRSPAAKWSSEDADLENQTNFRITFSSSDSSASKKQKSAADSTQQDNVDFFDEESPPSPIDSLCPQPHWPIQAIDKGVSKGRVVAQVFVDKIGMVRKWKIVKIDPVGMGFAQEVEYVLRKWRFRPAIQQGQPVGVWVAVPFNFRR